MNWETRTLALGGWFGEIAYGGGLFAGLLRRDWPAEGAEILTSPDGLSWKMVASIPTCSLTGIVYGNGRFVAGASDGTVLESPDGITWTRRPFTDTTGYPTLVAFGNGLFLAKTYGSLWRSADGVRWSQCATPFRQAVTLSQSVWAGAGTFLAMGEDSVLYQSDPIEHLENPIWLPGQGLEWTIAGAPNLNYRIDFSEDLLNWQMLTRVTNAPATRSFTDPNAAARPRRFYRTVTE